jgi:hypothetical protein
MRTWRVDFRYRADPNERPTMEGTRITAPTREEALRIFFHGDAGQQRPRMSLLDRSRIEVTSVEDVSAEFPPRPLAGSDQEDWGT